MLWNLVKALILNELVNPTSNHQNIISVIVPLIWPEIVRYRGLRAKKKKISKKTNIVHSGSQSEDNSPGESY